MGAARDGFVAALAATAFADPAAPAFSPTTVTVVEDPADILATALTAPVRFRESILALHEAGAVRWIETGPGEVLSKLVTRTLTDPDVRVHDVREAADVA
jgi:acyl transferase domain-containing protein